MSDVLFFQTPDGGEIQIQNGLVGTTDGPEVAAYLSLFGGNLDDSGQAADDSKQWWGNAGEKELANKYRSSFQNLLYAVPLISSNLQRFEEAALDDLSWMIDSVATDIAVRATMPGPKRVDVDCAMTVNGQVLSFTLAR